MPSQSKLVLARWIGSLVAVSFFLCLPAFAQTRVIATPAYEAALSGLTVSFLARDLASDTDYVLAGSDLDSRHAPFSTFKIPNLVIALETGAAASLDDWRPWIPEKRPAEAHWPDEWRQDQTLKQAFARSAVWYFRDLALEIGGTVYRETLTEWGYGNAAAPTGSDDFWLDGTLTISLREQVEFLTKLLEGHLGVRPQIISALDEASLSGHEAGVSIHGKTGVGPDDPANTDGAFSGWYVGYLRREGMEPVVFALYAKGPSFGAISQFRRAFALQLLTDIGLLGATDPF